MATLGKVALFAAIDADITTNGNNEITGLEVNTLMKSLSDSSVNKVDENHFWLRNYNPARAYAVGFTCIESDIIYRANQATTGAFTIGHWDVISDTSASENLTATLTAGNVSGLFDIIMNPTSITVPISGATQVNSQATQYEVATWDGASAQTRVYKIFGNTTNVDDESSLDVDYQGHSLCSFKKDEELSIYSNLAVASAANAFSIGSDSVGSRFEVMSVGANGATHYTNTVSWHNGNTSAAKTGQISWGGTNFHFLPQAGYSFSAGANATNGVMTIHKDTLRVGIGVGLSANNALDVDAKLEIIGEGNSAATFGFMVKPLANPATPTFAISDAGFVGVGASAPVGAGAFEEKFNVTGISYLTDSLAVGSLALFDVETGIQNYWVSSTKLVGIENTVGNAPAGTVKGIFNTVTSNGSTVEAFGFDGLTSIGAFDIAGFGIKSRIITTIDSAGTSELKAGYFIADPDGTTANGNRLTGLHGLAEKTGGGTDATGIWRGVIAEVDLTQYAGADALAFEARGGSYLHQNNATAATPVATMEQTDLSEEFIDFVATEAVGNPVEDVGAKSLTTTKFIKVSVNGVNLYLQAGTIA